MRAPWLRHLPLPAFGGRMLLKYQCTRGCRKQPGLYCYEARSSPQRGDRVKLSSYLERVRLRERTSASLLQSRNKSTGDQTAKNCTPSRLLNNLKSVQIKLELNQPLGIGGLFGVRRLWRRFGSPGSSMTLSMKLASWKRLPKLRQRRRTPKSPPMSRYLIDLNRL